MTLLAATSLAAGCQSADTTGFSLEAMLRSQPERFGTVMQDPRKYRVQIVYSQIDRDADNTPTFTTYSFRADPAEYFYPASTVKLPTALLALEKINQLNVNGLDRDTTMLTDIATDMQTPAVADATSPTGLPSIGHYIRKVLLVSDNDAFNRLYEFVGQQPLNEALQRKGYNDSRIVHRLSIARNDDENARTNPIVFVAGDTVIHRQEAAVSNVKFTPDQPVELGVAEIIDGERIEQPKDFSVNNKFAVQDQHEVIKAVMFPNDVAKKRAFDLTDDDYRFLYANLSGYPGDSGIEAYADAERYPEGYVKFFMFGGDADTIPDNLRIFNKVGDAYGFLTDTAYIVDFDSGVEFLLTATVFTNDNLTFNDNEYEYDEIGLPFLRDLGQAIYERERVRARARQPDLSRFGP